MTVRGRVAEGRRGIASKVSKVSKGKAATVKDAVKAARSKPKVAAVASETLYVIRMRYHDDEGSTWFFYQDVDSDGLAQYPGEDPRGAKTYTLAEARQARRRLVAAGWASVVIVREDLKGGLVARPPAEILQPPQAAQETAGDDAIEVLERMTFNVGSAAKLLWARGKKSEKETLEDLRKAKWYLEREIARLTKGEKVQEI